VGRVVEPGRGDQHRPAGRHGIDDAERAFRNAGADDCRGEPSRGKWMTAAAAIPSNCAEICGDSAT